MAEDILQDIPTMLDGDIAPPMVAPSNAAFEDAPVGALDDTEGAFREPLKEDIDATTYFQSVPEEEALNFIMFLHDTHSISFERLNQLKLLLTNTETAIPI